MKKDYCDEAGAARVKAKLEKYWAERGHCVEVTTQFGGFTPEMRSCRVDVRSDMVNGWPRNYSPVEITNGVRRPAGWPA